MPMGKNMRYKVLIKKCEDPQTASAIAAEVARWSGSASDVVYNAITQKDICVRREADEAEARSLQVQFSAAGAQVEVVPADDGAGMSVAAAAAAASVVMPAVAVAAGVAPAPQPRDNEDDDEPGRVLTDDEYAEMLKQRPDVFHIEKASGTRNTQLVCMIMAIAMGIFLSTREAVAIVAADFFDRMPQPERNTVLSKELVERQEEIAAKEERKQEEAPTDRKTLRPTESRGQNAQGGGGGDPRSRVTQVGVLGIIGGKITGKTVASADIFGQGGFATDIDAILSGVGGLRPGADGGSGRAGVSGIGFGDGVGSGFGTTGMGGVGDLLDGLMNSRGGGGNLDLKTRGEIRVSSPQIQIGGALSGGRSRISIQRVVLQNMAALRHAYNRRLRDNPGLAGRITVRFAIDEFGSVTFAQMVESTMNDHELERLIVERVHTWRFEKIDKPGDITEVTYPFVFTQ